jgi:hypothetical protein
VLQRWNQELIRRPGAHQLGPELHLTYILTVAEWQDHASQRCRCSLKPPILFVFKPSERYLCTGGLPDCFTGGRVRRLRAIVGFDGRANQPDRKRRRAEEQAKEDERGNPGQHGDAPRLLPLSPQRGLGRIDEVLLARG